MVLVVATVMGVIGVVSAFFLFYLGERVFHRKFGYGRVTAVEDNRVDVDFDKSDPKRVLDSFLERAS